KVLVLLDLSKTVCKVLTCKRDSRGGRTYGTVVQASERKTIERTTLLHRRTEVAGHGSGGAAARGDHHGRVRTRRIDPRRGARRILWRQPHAGARSLESAAATRAGGRSSPARE